MFIGRMVLKAFINFIQYNENIANEDMQMMNSIATFRMIL